MTKRFSEQGQALVEYVLMLAVALSVVGIVGYGFRRIVLHAWQAVTCDVAAACPRCPVDEEIKNRIANGACKDE